MARIIDHDGMGCGLLRTRHALVPLDRIVVVIVGFNSHRPTDFISVNHINQTNEVNRENNRICISVGQFGAFLLQRANSGNGIGSGNKTWAGNERSLPGKIRKCRREGQRIRKAGLPVRF